MIKCLSVLFVSFLFLMTGCAPKVITNISKSYPASVTADKVRLYELGEAVPASAERIGNVSVVDNGVSTKCNYDQVVWLAKQETVPETLIHLPLRQISVHDRTDFRL